MGDTEKKNTSRRERRSRGFLSGVSYLTVSALLVKIMGFLYRIPMLTYLGTEGMGYFNTAYELYALFCIISTAGLPVAMSVMISSCETQGKRERVKRIFRVSLIAFLLVGGVGTLVLYGFSDALAHLLKNQGAAAGIRMISPTVLLICVSSAFRGYFQGKQSMAPTAVSQVIEASGKLLLGVTFAAYAHGQGKDLPTVAAYAVLGLTVGTGISVLYLWVQKLIWDRKKSTAFCETVPEDDPKFQDLRLLRRLAAIAVPVTLGAGVMGVTKLIDVALIMRRLQATGMSATAAASAYGCYSTLAVPVFNMIPSLTTSVSLSVVPALSAALGQGEQGRAEASRVTASALRMTMLFAIPAALGICVFSKDVLSLLFGHQPTAVAEAAPWLACLGLAIPASCLITVSGALLQAVGHPERPVISMLAGIAVKAVTAYLLIGDPRVGMMGAAVSTLACDTVIALCNLCFLVRIAPWLLPTPKQSAELLLLPTLLAGISVCAVVLLRHSLGVDGISTLSTLVSIASVACLYGGGWLLILSRKRAGAKGR